MRFGSTAKVLLKCKLKYYRISECNPPVPFPMPTMISPTQIPGLHAELDKPTFQPTSTVMWPALIPATNTVPGPVPSAARLAAAAAAAAIPTTAAILYPTAPHSKHSCISQAPIGKQGAGTQYTLVECQWFERDRSASATQCPT